MRVAIITTAGISSRFNRGVPEAKKKLKAIYTEGDKESTLLYHLLKKCAYIDRIIVVGGYKYDALKEYCSELEPVLRDKITLTYNEHYENLSSGYSLYLGLEEVLQSNVTDVLFVEGDLDVDNESFKNVVNSGKSVLTYTYEPIYANKAVVLYKDEKGQYRYVFNSSHGLLSIDKPFSCILNSGQIWKFSEIDVLRHASEKFVKETKDDTNLRIIQNYLDSGVEADIVPLSRWTNCNTMEDYKKIVTYWGEEQ